MKIKLPISGMIRISCFALTTLSLNAQISFTNSNAVLHSNTGVLGSNANARSGNSVTVADMNYDGLDDICKLIDNGEVRIEYQQPGGSYTYQYIGTMGTTQAWAMCAGDVDKNGYKDVIAGYGTLLKLMKIGPSGSMGVTTLPGSYFVQNINFMDVNADGWIDIFACDDNAFPKLYLNDGTGSFPSEAGNTVINFDVAPGQTIGSSNDDSGNYGSVWTDFDNDGDVDLYVAHCRQSVSSGTDARRIDKLFVNNGSNVFTEMASTYGVASGDQDWTSSFGDTDNDGDFDLFLTKHNTTSKLYTNDGTGHFTAGNNVTFGSMPMQAQFEDLDNDAFVDLIITGDNDHRIYHNNGNGTFSDVTPANLTAGSNLLSFATGDLNHDGRIDIYGSYGTTYNNPGTQDDIFWKNTTSNSNHFLTLVMIPSLSNKDALGTKARIYGSWGVQTREVRAGESYGTMNSGHLHFGLGGATAIDSVVVTWPSGIKTVIANPGADQFLNVGEQNPCTLSGASISPSGSTNLCTGDSITLTATSTSTGTYTYLWSTGATTSSINVSTAGSYAVTITESGMCNSTSPSVSVTINANETPLVTASSSVLTFCEGNSVTLTSSPASSYAWSDGSTTQSIVVTTSGNYSVTIQGACQSWSSTATSVTVLPAPAVPSGSDIYISGPQSVTLTATGNSDVWFDAPTGGNQVGTGNNYTTGIVTQDTTFYVEDQNSYGGSSAFTGQTYHYGSSYSGSTATNAYSIFDVLNPCTLNTVKVYTDTPGNRLIELRNSSGTVINSVMVNIPVDTSVITLNFPLAVGNGYQLGTNAAQNNTLLGYASPRLKRSSSNVTYPYTLANLVSITNSSQGSTVYYYFYDWNVVEAPSICPGPRHPQSVLFNVVGINESATMNTFSVFPNPAKGSVNIVVNKDYSTPILIELTDLTGRIVATQSVSKIAKGQQLNFNLAEVAQGAYFLKLKNDTTQLIKKLIVE
ncbi:MAG: FG-GAP-like repeat-containing protein [Bacteroidia bacterium]